MKVTHGEPAMLVIESRPWLLGILLGGFILVFVGAGLGAFAAGEGLGGLMLGVMGGGLGFLAFWAFVRRVQVILDRGRGTVTLRERSMTGMTETVMPLTDGARAFLQRGSSGGKGGPTWRPVLHLPGASADSTGPRDLPLMQSYTNGGGPRRAVSAINAWLGQADDGAS